MAIEIERKFRVISEGWRQRVHQSTAIRQGYLATTAHASTRVRISDAHATLNIKQAIPGTTRLEYEYPIPLSDATVMLDQLCERPLLEKTRHLLQQGGLLWEIDEFHSENTGLIVAEVELTSAEQTIDRPDWLGEEVTEELRFYNVSLLAKPYCLWSEDERC